MGKKILKIPTRLNMQRLKEEQDEALNDAKENGTIENIEEIDKLRQIMEDKKGDVIYISEE